MPITGDGRFYLPDDPELVLALPRDLPDQTKLPVTLATFLRDEDEQRAAAEFIRMMRPVGTWAGVVDKFILWHLLTHGRDGQTKWLINALNRLGRADYINSRTIDGREFYLPDPKFARLALNLPLPS